MEYKVKDRKENLSVVKESKSVRFFYGTALGRCFVYVFSRPIFSRFVGWVLSTRFSCVFIKGFIKKNNVDLSLYKDVSYNSFNDFFVREKKVIDVLCDEDIFVSPCDGRLMCYEIDKNSKFFIKNSYYSTSDLIMDKVTSKKYNGGYALVFRLAKEDYHRYLYIDDGVKSGNVYIPGVLNTVRPIVYSKYNIFKMNSREYTILYTKNFGDVIEIEVGATLVGKIRNKHGRDYQFKKGEEKGYFMFGGSTIVLLVKKDMVKIDQDILKNSKDGVETLVSAGSRIGKKSLK